MLGGDKLKDFMVKVVEDNPKLVQRILKENMKLELTNDNGILKVQVKYHNQVVAEGEVDINCHTNSP